mmetsp:Transcript_38957/g.63682  ORF Transcript_38957/g.63682 Transcript_38957/m.63682 type:complete len:306 (-) Transcript_38957:1061-1978(-)
MLFQQFGSGILSIDDGQDGLHVALLVSHEKLVVLARRVGQRADEHMVCGRHIRQSHIRRLGQDRQQIVGIVPQQRQTLRIVIGHQVFHHGVRVSVDVSELGHGLAHILLIVVHQLKLALHRIQFVRLLLETRHQVQQELDLRHDLHTAIGRRAHQTVELDIRVRGVCLVVLLPAIFAPHDLGNGGHSALPHLRHKMVQKLEQILHARQFQRAPVDVEQFCRRRPRLRNVLVLHFRLAARQGLDRSGAVRTLDANLVGNRLARPLHGSLEVGVQNVAPKQQVVQVQLGVIVAFGAEVRRRRVTRLR